MTASFVDIHCHLLPGIDDGANDWDQSLTMARLAVEDGTSTIVATPHQLGSFGTNRGETIRTLARELQTKLDEAQIPLTVLPGAEIRIEEQLVDGIVSGDLLSLGDHRKHVLIELPHELYLPLDPLLDALAQQGIVGVLAHPERNQGLMQQPTLIESLVDRGCLMQITAGSLCGTLGSEPQEISEWMVNRELVHLVATDAHGPRSRRPLLGRVHERLCELADEPTANDLCIHNPAQVAAGRSIPAGRRQPAERRRTSWWRRKVAA